MFADERRLNYGKHIAEGTVSTKAPKEPTLFIKSSSSLTDPETDVEVPKMAQDGTVRDPEALE